MTDKIANALHRTDMSGKITPINRGVGKAFADRQERLFRPRESEGHKDRAENDEGLEDVRAKIANRANKTATPVEHSGVEPDRDDDQFQREEGGEANWVSRLTRKTGFWRGNSPPRGGVQEEIAGKERSELFIPPLRHPTQRNTG